MRILNRSAHQLSIVLLLAVAQITSAADETQTSMSRPSNGGQTSRPNFLIITSEDMSPDLGCYGDTYARTPHPDALAAKGVRYSAAFANGPICSSARTALLFSMYRYSLGAGNHRSKVKTSPDLLGFAAHLCKAGYFTCNLRKVDYNTTNVWDIEHATYAHNRDWRAKERKGRPFLSIINLEVSHQSRTSVWPYAQFVKQVQSKLAPTEIHDHAQAIVPPYFPATPEVRKELARYADCVTLMDRQAGEILERLAADGLADDTIVIYFSDHGADHPRYKSTPYNTGYRVPWIVYCPPRFEHLLRAPVGGVCDDVVMFIDVGPTLLNLAGIHVPEGMHGVPFMGPGVKPRNLAYGARDRREHSFNHVRTATG